MTDDTKDKELEGPMGTYSFQESPWYGTITCSGTGPQGSNAPWFTTIGAGANGGNGGSGGSLGISSSPYITNSNGSNYKFTYPNYQSALKVDGDAEFEGDIKWKGKSLNGLIENIEKRLAILQPDPKKLEKFESLRKAYEHYKTLEALCDLDDSDKK